MRTAPLHHVANAADDLLELYGETSSVGERTMTRDAFNDLRREELRLSGARFVCSATCSRQDLDAMRVTHGITVDSHTPSYFGSSKHYGIKRNGAWWWIAYLSKDQAEDQADRLAAQLIAEY